jgi:hypothetical protein
VFEVSFFLSVETLFYQTWLFFLIKSIKINNKQFSYWVLRALLLQENPPFQPFTPPPLLSKKKKREREKEKKKKLLLAKRIFPLKV